MRTYIMVLFILSALIPAWAHEGETHSTPAPYKVLMGELVDTSRYLTHDSKRKEHKACALTCVNDGAPISLLDKMGKVTLLIPHHNTTIHKQLKDLLAENVEITGEGAEKGGIKVFVVYSVKKR